MLRLTRLSRKSPTSRTGTTHCVRDPSYAPSSQSPVSLREMATSSETKFLGSQQAMLAWENWRRRTFSTNPLNSQNVAMRLQYTCPARERDRVFVLRCRRGSALLAALLLCARENQKRDASL
jgi:hypothetical protein